MYDQDPNEPMNAQRLVSDWARQKRQQDNNSYWQRIHRPFTSQSQSSGAGPAHGGWPWIGVMLGSFFGIAFTPVTPNDSEYLLGALKGAAVGGLFFWGLTFVFRAIGRVLGLIFGGIGAGLARLQGFPNAARRGATWGAGLGFVDNLYTHHDSLAAFGFSAVALGGMAGMALHAIGLIRGRLRGG